MEPLQNHLSTLAAVGLYIMAGSFLLPDGEKMVNRAMLFGPSGELIGTRTRCTDPAGRMGSYPRQALNLFDTAVEAAMPVHGRHLLRLSAS